MGIVKRLRPLFLCLFIWILQQTFYLTKYWLIVAYIRNVGIIPKFMKNPTAFPGAGAKSRALLPLGSAKHPLLCDTDKASLVGAASRLRPCLSGEERVWAEPMDLYIILYTIRISFDSFRPFLVQFPALSFP